MPPSISSEPTPFARTWVPSAILLSTVCTTRSLPQIISASCALYLVAFYFSVASDMEHRCPISPPTPTQLTRSPTTRARRSHPGWPRSSLRKWWTQRLPTGSGRPFNPIRKSSSATRRPMRTTGEVGGAEDTWHLRGITNHVKNQWTILFISLTFYLKISTTILGKKVYTHVDIMHKCLLFPFDVQVLEQTGRLLQRSSKAL